MEEQLNEFDDLFVSIDEVVYMPGLDAPGDKPHPFVYFITIRNDSPVSVTLKGRKWVVREMGGEVTVVEGEGIVGQMPVLEPGENFSYNSYHVVAADATVQGAFFGVSAMGDRVFVRIPNFQLKVPT
ncbi:MAG: Co(2+)/Mg(2+) efflux protein ApaG [Luteolibacter sp.]